MKIVTWNCNGGFHKKFQVLQKLDADIYVVQECGNPQNAIGAYKEWAKNSFWVGERKASGLGVFASRSVKIDRLNWDDNGLQFFLPVRINDRFNLVGVWTKYANSPSFCYIGQLWKYLQLHKDKMSATHTVVCGDLNSNSIWDLKHTQGNHSDVIRELNAIDMVSLYHTITGEEQGKESKPTFYMQRNIQKPYHIDYAFLSKNLINLDDGGVLVGTHSEWLGISDHVPITFTIAW